jgi:hypothetical protein
MVEMAPGEVVHPRLPASALGGRRGLGQGMQEADTQAGPTFERFDDGAEVDPSGTAT